LNFRADIYRKERACTAAGGAAAYGPMAIVGCAGNATLDEDDHLMTPTGNFIHGLLLTLLLMLSLMLVTS